MFRRPFFWIGTVLWILVFILGFRMFVGPDKTVEETIPDDVLTSEEAETKPVDESPWSKEGLPEFTFTAHTGETVTKESLLGKPWVVGFIFTRCTGPCPKVSGQMGLLQEELRDTDVKLITISVDPKYDTVEKLQQYAKAYGVEPDRWLLLTGDYDATYDLIEKGFQMPVQEVEGADAGSKFVHTTNLMLVDENGVVQEKVNGVIDSEVQALRRKLAKQYPSENAKEEGTETGDDDANADSPES
ncbi:MAG: hypothetical protein CMJ46_01970 [Planctomyces sp.]|nr:hypothetical protein [Planctomyces sp.]